MPCLEWSDYTGCPRTWLKANTSSLCLNHTGTEGESDAGFWLKGCSVRFAPSIEPLVEGRLSCRGTWVSQLSEPCDCWQIGAWMCIWDEGLLSRRVPARARSLEPSLQQLHPVSAPGSASEGDGQSYYLLVPALSAKNQFSGPILELPMQMRVWVVWEIWSLLFVKKHFQCSLLGLIPCSSSRAWTGQSSRSARSKYGLEGLSNPPLLRAPKTCSLYLPFSPFLFLLSRPSSYRSQILLLFSPVPAQTLRHLGENFLI